MVKTLPSHAGGVGFIPEIKDFKTQRINKKKASLSFFWVK